jgi:hypothetical protein
MEFCKRLAMVFGMLLLARVALAAPPVRCDITPGGVCPSDVGAAVAACCDCEGAGNHGQYVSCVAHAANTLRKAGCLDKEARRSIKQCAARSTCGKPGFVTCCRAKPGVCVDGFCLRTDPPLPCLTDAECPLISHCSVKRSVEACTLVAGTAGESASCCDACGG